MSGDQHEVIGLFKIWRSIEIGIFTFGLLLNFSLIIIFIKFRQVSEGIMSVGLLQTFVDFIICFIALINSSAPTLNLEINSDTYGFILCHLVYSDALLWSIIGIRINLNFMTSLYYFTKFLFPFIHIETKRKILYIILIIMIFTSCLFSLLPHLLMNEYDKKNHICIRSLGYFYTSHKGYQILFRQATLIGFLYNFLLPLIISMYLYYCLLKCLRLNTKIRKSAAYHELVMNTTQDILILFLLSFMPEMRTFLSEYPTINTIETAPEERLFSKFTLYFYSVLYPCMCIIFRRRYQKPINSFLLLMGINIPRMRLKKRRHTSTYSSTKSKFHRDLSHESIDEISSSHQSVETSLRKRMITL